MSLVPSLLQAIVRVDGEALVMHAGDKPYVVAPTGQVDLASRGFTHAAVQQPDDAYGADHHHAVAVTAPDDDELPEEVLGFDPAPVPPQPLAMSAELQSSDDVVEIEGDLGLPVETDLWPGRTPAPV